MAKAVVVNQITRAVTNDLVCDVRITDGYVSRLRRIHFVDSVTRSTPLPRKLGSQMWAKMSIG